MDLSGNKFIYDGVKSSQYGLKFMEVNTQRFVQVSGNMTYQNTFLNAPKRRVANGLVYSDSSPEFDVEIISETPITAANRRTIEKWLFYKTEYKKLYVDPTSKDEGETISSPYTKVDTNYLDFSNSKLYPYTKCVFTNPSIIEYSSGLHGWQCTCVTDSPFATLDRVKIVQSNSGMTNYSSGFKSFTINIDSDMPDYIFPKIWFTLKSNAGDNLAIIWKNATDDINRQFYVGLLPAGTSLYCDSEINRLSNTSGRGGVNYYPYIVERNFPRLLPGNNQIVVGDNINTVTIIWDNRRWFL